MKYITHNQIIALGAAESLQNVCSFTIIGIPEFPSGTSISLSLPDYFELPCRLIPFIRNSLEYFSEIVDLGVVRNVETSSISVISFMFGKCYLSITLKC